MIVLMPHFDLPQLAADLVQDMYPTDEILMRHGFDGPGDARWLAIRHSSEFSQLLSTLAEEWSRADSTPKRLKVKAAVALEHLLPILVARAAEAPTSMKDSTVFARLLSDMAGVMPVPGHSVPGTGSSFSLRIVIQPSGVPEAGVVIEHSAPDPPLDPFLCA